MHIQELSLHTRHLAGQKAFYRIILGLPLLAETADSFTIQAGTTRLRFQEGQQDVLYHVAFTIPRNTFIQAKSWLRELYWLLSTSVLEIGTMRMIMTFLHCLQTKEREGKIGRCQHILMLE